jgi:hypothetical protein
MRGLSFQFAGLQAYRLSDIDASLSDVSGEVARGNIALLALQPGLNSLDALVVTVDVLRPSQVAAVLNTLANPRAESLNLDAHIKMGVSTWFPSYFRVGLHVPLHFKSGRQHAEDSAGGADAAGRMHVGQFVNSPVTPDQTKASSGTSSSTSASSALEDGPVLNSIHFSDSTAGGVNASASISYSYSDPTFGAFSLQLRSPILVQLYVSNGTAGKISLGSKSVPLNDRELGVSVSVGNADAAGLARALEFFSTSGTSANIVLGISGVPVSLADSGVACGMLQQIVSSVTAEVNYSRAVCTAQASNAAIVGGNGRQSPPGSIAANVDDADPRVSTKASSSEYSVLLNLFTNINELKWVPSDSHVNEMLLDVWVSKRMFRHFAGPHVAISGVFPGFQAHIITGQQHCLSIGVIAGTTIKAHERFRVQLFVRVPNSSHLDQEFVQKYSSSLASAASLCPRGKHGAHGQRCVSCPAGRYAPIEGMVNCMVCPPASVSSAINAIVCLRCPRGKYNFDASVPQCTPCRAGVCPSKSFTRHQYIPPSAFVIGDLLLAPLLNGEPTEITVRFGGSPKPELTNSFQYKADSVLGTAIEGVEFKTVLWNSTASNISKALELARIKHKNISSGIRGLFLGEWQLNDVGADSIWAMRHETITIPSMISAPDIDIGAPVREMSGSSNGALMIDFGAAEAPIARVGFAMGVNRHIFTTDMDYKAHVSLFHCSSTDPNICARHKASLSSALAALLQGQAHKTAMSFSHRGFSVGISAFKLPRGLLSGHIDGEPDWEGIVPTTFPQTLPFFKVPSHAVLFGRNPNPSLRIPQGPCVVLIALLNSKPSLFPCWHCEEHCVEFDDQGVVATEPCWETCAGQCCSGDCKLSVSPVNVRASISNSGSEGTLLVPAMDPSHIWPLGEWDLSAGGNSKQLDEPPGIDPLPLGLLAGDPTCPALRTAMPHNSSAGPNVNAGAWDSHLRYQFVGTSRLCYGDVAQKFCVDVINPDSVDDIAAAVAAEDAASVVIVADPTPLVTWMWGYYGAQSACREVSSSWLQTTGGMDFSLVTLGAGPITMILLVILLIFGGFWWLLAARRAKFSRIVGRPVDWELDSDCSSMDDEIEIELTALAGGV